MSDEQPFSSLGFAEEAAVFDSASQNVRVLSEGWAALHLYCPNCGAAQVRQHPNNTKARDFFCESCREDYELKAGRGRFTGSVPDGAYDTFMAAVRERRNANLVLMRYDAARTGVSDVMVVPRHFISPEVVQRRKPLAETARRAGWTGCNILVSGVPETGRVWLLRERERVAKPEVLQAWRRAKPLKALDPRRAGVGLRGAARRGGAGPAGLPWMTSMRRRRRCRPCTRRTSMCGRRSGSSCRCCATRD